MEGYRGFGQFHGDAGWILIRDGNCVLELSARLGRVYGVGTLHLFGQINAWSTFPAQITGIEWQSAILDPLIRRMVDFSGTPH